MIVNPQNAIIPGEDAYGINIIQIVIIWVTAGNTAYLTVNSATIMDQDSFATIVITTKDIL